MANLNYQQVLGYAQNAGFQGQSANTIAAIAMAESSGDPNAFNANDPNGGSFGLTQINGIHAGASSAQGDPQTAMNLAYTVSGGGTNFTPWSQYNNGNYLSFLPGGASASGGGSPVNAGAGTLWQQLMNSLGGGSNPTLGSQLGSTAQQAATDALGNAISSQLSPLSQIFSAIGDLFQRGGIILLGIIFLGIGAYALTRPKIAAAVKRTVR